MWLIVTEIINSDFKKITKVLRLNKKIFNEKYKTYIKMTDVYCEWISHFPE